MTVKRFILLAYSVVGVNCITTHSPHPVIRNINVWIKHGMPFVAKTYYITPVLNDVIIDTRFTLFPNSAFSDRRFLVNAKFGRSEEKINRTEQIY